jgi:hypothetical protein
VKAIYTAILSYFMSIPEKIPDVRQRIEDLKTRTPAKIRNLGSIYDQMSI